MSIELAVFLGNPGPKYAYTRHNAAWLLADTLPGAFGTELYFQTKFKGRYAETGGRKFLLPETFMNDSGMSVQEAAAFYKIPANAIIVAHDEIELPLGTVSLKYGGGLGGHNGLRSIKACISTADFWRLRIGVGRPGDREPGKGGREGEHGDIVGWVLSSFSEAETPVLEQSLNAAAELLGKVFDNEPESLLKEYAKYKVDY
ncbi:MAG: aminoacyl-tRNA hydrolase [Spirochaetaceae bacterium]|jgi:PTH1 family peptidyl-tRNA hydrolase|nr:aminoacyl-tRNA hydrolase [Spirochaetaceae bacterium]